MDIQNIAKKYVQTNAFFAHSSNLWVTMLTEDDISIKQQAVDGMIEIRKKIVNIPQLKEQIQDTWIL